MRLTPEAIEECVRVLESLVEDRTDLADTGDELRNRLLIAAGRVSRPERDEQKQLSREARRKKRRDISESDRAILARAGIRQKRLERVFLTPDRPVLVGGGGGAFDRDADAASNAAQTTSVEEEELPPLNVPRSCYVCKTRCVRMHTFYDQMCSECGDFNFEKRSQTADLRGRVALISGARVKIGYQAAILLLRAGARVIVTTRFPRDAALRYARETDFEEFRDRLQIYGLDLRHSPSVEAFADTLGQRESRLDFVLHNACQTVRRPTGFYQHLMDGELGPLSLLTEQAARLLTDYEELRASNAHRLGDGEALAPAALGLQAASALSQVALAPEDRDASPALFPLGALDADLQQVDRRSI